MSLFFASLSTSLLLCALVLWSPGGWPQTWLGRDDPRGLTRKQQGRPIPVAVTREVTVSLVELLGLDGVGKTRKKIKESSRVYGPGTSIASTILVPTCFTILTLFSMIWTHSEGVIATAIILSGPNPNATKTCYLFSVNERY